MAFNWEEVIVSAFVGPITIVGTQKLVEVFDKLQADNPDAYKTVMLALYPIVDLQLEKITSKTKTKIDDAFVTALKGAVEQSAAKYGIELVNADED